MKRILAVFTALLLCLLPLANAVSADEAQFPYSDDDIEDLYYDFDSVSGMVEALFGSDQSLAYWKYAHDMEDKTVTSWLIGMSNKIIGEVPDKEYYAEILTNMIAMFEYDMASQIEKQSQFDNMKNVKDYGLDLLDIGATVIGLEGKNEIIENALEAASNGLDMLMDTVDDVKYYELTVQNYAKAENFLLAVNEYSDNEKLSQAAYELRTANELLFKERVRCIASTADNIGVFTAKTFLSDFSFSIMKNLSEYKTDSIIKDYVDYGEKAYDALDRLVSTGEAVFKVVMLGGDLLFGTTNTFRRHNEMMAMADIAEALVAAYSDITVSVKAPAQTLYNSIRTKCEYYKMLLATHLRGEYLIYSLNYNDAGVLSQLSRWTDDYFRDENQTIKSWYQGQTDTCEKYYNMVNNVFSRLLSQKYVVHNGFELHDGFIVEIEQLDTVPDGYIGVYSFDDFKKIADSCPSDAFITSIYDVKTEYNTAKYILMNDIVCPEEYDSAGAFYGVLDGNGYTMKNLSKPLFIRVGNATIRNLGVEINCTMDTDDGELTFGAIAQYPNAWNNDKGVTFDNCFVKGDIDITCRSGQFGGIIGYGDGAAITNCYNAADISVKTRQSGNLGGICGQEATIANCFNTGSLSLYTTCENTFNAYSVDVIAGGIQGYNYSDSIRNCYNTGSVSASSPKGCQVSSGGIIGFNYGSVTSTYLENCYNLGRITDEWADTYDTTKEYGGVFTACFSSGGIVGYSGSSLYIKNCWNGGEISGEHFVGGIIGFFGTKWTDAISDCYNIGSVSAVQYAGGILGYDYISAGILNCFNTGIISRADHCGAIAATIHDGEEKLKSCYYIDNGVPATSGGINYSGVKVLTAEQMTDPASFEGFDFVETWVLREGDPTPTLKQ
ncbi:MAG: hypothetical protein ACI3YK_00530 [Eubacteriales bacterium]